MEVKYNRIGETCPTFGKVIGVRGHYCQLGTCNPPKIDANWSAPLGVGRNRPRF